MKIASYFQKTLFVCFLIFLSSSFLPTLHAGEFFEGAAKEALEGVDKEAMASVESAAEEILGKDLPPPEALPSDVTEGFKTNLKNFLEDAVAKLKNGTMAIKDFLVDFKKNLTESFQKFKSDVLGFKGKLTESQIESLVNSGKFSPEEAANIRALEGPTVRVPEGVEVSTEAIPKEQTQLDIDTRDNAAAEVETKLQELSDATTPEEISTAQEGLKEAQTNLDQAQKKLEVARKEEVSSAESQATQQEAATQKAQTNLDQAQTSGQKETVQKAQDNLEDQQKAKAETQDQARQTKIKAAKETYDDAQQNYKNAKNASDAAKKKLSGMKDGDPGYQEARQAVEDSSAVLGEAENTLTAAKENWEKVSQATKPWTSKAFDWVKENVLQQLFVGFVFMAPGWVQQSVSEAMQRKALLETLQKNQQFGKIYMTLPRCFINSNHPAASLYMYVGLEAENKDKKFIGSEEYLKKPANYYVAAPSYGDWASVAITDPTFPNIMGHLDTGFVFDGDGALAEVNCPSMQLVGETPQYSECKTVLQDDKLNKLTGPVAAGTSGTQEVGQFFLQATGYAGSPTIEELLDSTRNSDWKTFYPEVKTNNITNLMYGSLLNPVIGAFRSKTTVGNFALQELQGLDKDLGKIDSGAEGAEKKPYVAQGLCIYQTQDTPELKTVLHQLSIKQQGDLIPFVWDYMVVLDEGGKVTQLHEIQPGDNNFQHYTFDPNQTKVKYLCSLLQTGIIGGAQQPFKVYDLDGDAWKTSTDTNFSSPLDKNANPDFVALFSQDNRLQKQIASMYSFIQGRVVSGPFTIGSQQLEISEELLAAKIPVYKVAGSLADGSDDYVVAVSWPPNIVTLPDASAKYLWSLVTSRVYQPGNFAPNTEEWYAKISGDGSDAAPYKVGFSNVPKDGFPYKLPLYSVIMPQSVNPNIITYNNQQMRVPASDLYATKILPMKASDAVQTVNQVLGSQESSEVIKSLWQAINASFASWKSFLEFVEDGQQTSLDTSILPKTWVKNVFPPIKLSTTSQADIINGFYIYKTDQYPDEFLVMATSQNVSSPDIGKEFDDSNPQQYVMSLSTGNVYDAKNEGKLAPIPPLDTTILWQQVQKNANWPAKLQIWQSRITALQTKASPTKQELAELKMLQQLLVPQKQDNNISQAQANFNKLNNNIVQSQKIFGSQVASQQYGNNLFGPYNFFINKKDLSSKAYFYQDVTTISNPLQNLDSNGDVKGVTNYYVCGQTQKDGSLIWGYPLDGDADRILNLVTGAVFSRGGFQGTYAKFTESYTNASQKNSFQVLVDDYLNTVLASIKAQFGVSMRTELEAKIAKLLAPQYDLLEKEKKEIIQEENQQKAEYAAMDSNLIANLKSTQYLSQYSTLAQQYLKNYAGKYYLVSKDDDGNIVSYTDYNVGSPSKDNNVGAVYDAQGNMLIRVMNWLLENMRAKVGVVVDPKGVQSLAIGVDQPILPIKNMVLLASIPSGGKATSQAGVLQKKVDDSLAVFNNAMKAVKKSPQDQKAQQVVLQASADLSMNKLMYRSASMLNVAIENEYIQPASGWTYEYYFNMQTGSYFGKIILADKQAYYLELASGLTYDVDGMPRIRKDPVFIDSSSNLKAMNWFEGETKHRQFLAILPNSSSGKQYNVYRSTVQIPPSSYVPQAGQAGVAYNGEQAIQQQCTNLLDPGDDKQVITNDYIRGANKNVALMDVWDVATTASGDHLTKVGSFKPASGQYFAHLVYIQTRTSDQFLGLFDPKNVNSGDDLPTLMFWNGDSNLQLQQLYYQYQFIKLTASGSSSFTGTYTDAAGKAHAITVTKQKKILTTGSEPQMIAMWISITDGNKIIDYHYDTSIIEQNALNQLKQLWGINVVTDAYGQSSLAVKIGSIKTLSSVANVPKNQQSIINAVLANIRFDSAASRFLYKLTTDKAKSYNLESYDETMNNWYVDMQTGVLFDLNDYPSGKALHAVDMSKLMNNIQLGITFNQEGIPSGLHYRTATDVR